VASRAAPLTFALLVLAAAPSVAQRTPVALQIDAAASRIYIVTHRTGLLSFLGHEHAILAQQWRADVCWDEPSHIASRAMVVIDARSLDIDADSARALAGLGKGPSARQRAQIHAKLHDQKNLATAQYPELRFETTAVSQDEPGKVWIRGRLTIKGVIREIEMPVTVERHAADAVALTGSLTFRQSQFGIRPESIGGVVKVADPVDLHVSLSGRPSLGGC
jgi:polyisoprenoid-binding protein YceI